MVYFNLFYFFILFSTSKAELLKHCRRGTRGTEITIASIEYVLQTCRYAKDENQTPLFMDLPALDKAWEQARKHVPCIQDPDPEKLSLYEKIGTVKKGNTKLPVWRCIRGTNSTEGMHAHQFHSVSGKSYMHQNKQTLHQAA